MNEREQCSTCRFYAKRLLGMSGQGYCRRFPPAVRRWWRVARFPIVTDYNWCGEWEVSAALQSSTSFVS